MVQHKNLKRRDSIREKRDKSKENAFLLAYSYGNNKFGLEWLLWWRSYMASVAVVQSLSCVHSFRTNELQHTWLPCPSLSPRICSYPLSQWCYPTTSSSVALFSSCLQSFPAQGLFQWVNSLHQVAKVLKGFEDKHLWKTIFCVKILSPSE